MGFGLTKEEGLQCLEALGMLIGSLPMQYLGLPMKKNKMSRQDWQLVIEKVERRMEGWQATPLSRGGQLVLLRSILVAIPIFYRIVFTLPMIQNEVLSRCNRRKDTNRERE